ncbi:hypothetical protein OPHB3_1933 [Oceanobacillus picturae]|uniref:Uncharacterized protein n=1 Tax=Oceanobacillus picturae TaxID=171693 RepID=A0A0U9H5K7_9BACI|nr:hypothetical protein [Oceanobacillus picturae]GAQ17994.1 hypothetical protein OPHB3_1933 [Oceanobacillus picturae]
MSNLQAQYNNQSNGGTLAQASSSREMEEVKGQIFMARQFPRNVFDAENRILDACKRPALAQTAVYTYPRGGTKVEGPSIRLAEVLAQNWGNLSFGVKELEQREGESVALAYAWDLETNVRQEKVFTVKHSRKAGGKLKKLDDPRDIYELVANNGSRRVRACILGVIPGDIVEKAVEECNKTLQGNGKGPLKDRLATALGAFKDNYRITQDQIEERMGYNISAFTERDYADLIKIYTSMKDGVSKADDWFKKESNPSKQKENSNLTEAFNQTETEDTKKEESKPDKPKKEDVKADDNQEQAEFNIE